MQTLRKCKPFASDEVRLIQGACGSPIILSSMLIRNLHDRVSLDFRVGVEGFFDHQWQMIGTTDDHTRKKVSL